MAVEIRVGPFDEQTIIRRVIVLNPTEKDVEVQTVSLRPGFPC